MSLTSYRTSGIAACIHVDLVRPCMEWANGHLQDAVARKPKAAVGFTVSVGELGSTHSKTNDLSVLTFGTPARDPLTAPHQLRSFASCEESTTRALGSDGGCRIRSKSGVTHRAAESPPRRETLSSVSCGCRHVRPRNTRMGDPDPSKQIAESPTTRRDTPKGFSGNLSVRRNAPSPPWLKAD